MEKRIMIAQNEKFRMDERFLAELDRFRERGLEPVVVSMTSPRAEELTAKAAGYPLVLDVGCRWTAETLRALSGGLRAISIPAAGYDNVDVPAATEAGVAVMNSPGLSGPAVAEHAVALMLSVCREIVRLDSRMRDGIYRSKRSVQLTGKTVGVVGYGVIGRQLGRVLREGFDCRILASDQGRVGSEPGVEFVSLPELLRESDFVSLHLPLTPETRGMIGKAELAMMKPTAFLINTARGGVVDEEALIEALRNGVIAGAGLDVLAKEPPKPDNPLLFMENVVVTPHSASHVPQLSEAIYRRSVQNLLDFLDGKAEFIVNPDYREKASR